MRRWAQILVLACAALSQSGCGLFYVAAVITASALTPEPVSVITVMFAREPDVCRAMIGGDASHQVVQGALDRTYMPASIKRPADTAQADWKRRDDDPSFVILAGTKDAARAYYDFNNDGVPELVYEVFGPPDFPAAYVTLPPDERVWFESQLRGLTRDWRERVVAHGGHVVAISAADVAGIKQVEGLASTDTPVFIVLFHGGVSYVVRLQERLSPAATERLPHPFQRPPLSFGDPDDDAGAYQSVEVRGLYRIESDYSLTKECEFLEQKMEIRQASS
ncbi:MAG TPA: hypothetical protein VJV39_08130 [Dongiaceae bacterium]|nr:hypothetical protein [Dongiaceae bacterium]